jgi:hypothetical protein
VTCYVEIDGILCDEANAAELYPITPAMCDAWLADEGGVFFQGHSYEFTCEYTSNCGVEDECSWTVTVSDQSLMWVEVQLEPVVDNVLDTPLYDFQDCIEFEFYDDCQGWETRWYTLNFGGVYQFDGHARATIDVPKGNWQCLAAASYCHSLRSTADIVCDDTAFGGDGMFHAQFKGDPLMNGNWLIGGNLDGSKIIDIIDFGIVLSQWQKTKPQCVCGEGKQTAEPTLRPNADINNDGVVNDLDLGFVLLNFLEDDKATCCPEAGGVATAVMEITLADAAAQGLNLSAADLNKDGVINGDDITAFMMGARPETTTRAGLKR